ncbi:uncharacterized protein LOC135486820 [Lineus longissimus]|uniref:uncharacterized protein LOC135486820 n=1 Tax=Lineus longissimus TaxID=88925 RepID=UPI00315CAD1F
MQDLKGLELVTLLLVATCATADPYCTSLPPGVTGGGPRLPMIPGSYQTKIEVNVENQRSTWDAMEWFDGRNNRATIKMTSQGEELLLIYNYKDDQIYKIKDRAVCEVLNMTTSDTTTLIGIDFIDGLPHAPSVQDAFRFGTQFGQQYMGQTTVRGIFVDHWRSCQYWPAPGPNANFTLDFYFAASNNWTSAIGYPQMPVRAVATGVMPTENGVGLQNFKINFELSEFRPVIIDDVSIFQVPLGVICKGQTQDKQIPRLPDFFHYRVEMVQPTGHFVQFYETWYDKAYQIVRLDYRPVVATAPWYTTNPIREIHDYNTGVAYVTDTALGNCTIRAIQGTEADATYDIEELQKDGATVLRLKAPLDFLYIDASYIYKGKTTVRGMDTDVFIGQRNDFKGTPGQRGNTTVEYYFLTENWVEIPNPGVQVMQGVPVKAIFKNELSNFYMEYHFIDFDGEHSDLGVFDVLTCFPEETHKNVEITFKGDILQLNKEKSIFLQETRGIIAQSAGISPIRVQQPQVDYYVLRGEIYLTMTLLAPAPFFALFRPVANAQALVKADSVFTNQSGITCAQRCSQELNYVCESFESCPAADKCYLYKDFVASTDLRPSTECAHWTRTIKGSRPERELALAWMVIKNSIYTNNFFIDLPIGAGQTSRYTALSAREDIVRNVNRDERGSAVSQFTSFKNKVMNLNNNKILNKVVSVDDCAQACIDSKEFICESFDYCYTVGTCMLSTLHPEQHQDLVTDITFCDLYGRNFISKFHKKRGKTILADEPTASRKVSSAQECAKECVFSSEVDCRSFDYCDYNGFSVCLLGTRHIDDGPAEGVVSEPSCDHYSRNYFDDFQYVSAIETSLDGGTVISDVSPENCAKLCIDNLNNSCASFDYCGNTTRCFFHAKGSHSHQQVVQKDVDFCSHYERQYFPDGSSYIPGPAVTSMSGYAGGEMAALAIGMLIVGLLFGAVLLWGCSKLRLSKSADMQMSFVNPNSTT